jgi:hypothetical protein
MINMQRHLNGVREGSGIDLNGRRATRSEKGGKCTRGLIDVRNRWMGRLARRLAFTFTTRRITRQPRQSRQSSGTMGSNQSKTRTIPSSKQTPRIIGDIRFRVLVIGRANAGKTTILQRVCDTTESPKVYRRGEEVRSTIFVYKSDLTGDQVKLNPSMDVSDNSTSLHLPLNVVSARRAHHR